MRKKQRNKTPKPGKPRLAWMSAIRWHSLRRPAAVAVVILAAGGFVLAGSIALARLDEHVNRALLERNPDASVQFVDLPESLIGLAGGDLRGSIAELLDRDWTDSVRCREIAKRLSTIGWIADVRFVRRTVGGRFEIGARYRLPAAMVANRGDYVLIDSEGVRLPGVYVYQPRWYIIDGVESDAPPVGEKWPGADLQAGLTVLTALRSEPFRPQIVGVVVENFGGRRNARASHIELITDRPGGRIRWGSAPGFEVEENLLLQKLALLRQNFAQSGRADAGHDVIDVSTFPDRYYIPG